MNAIATVLAVVDRITITIGKAFAWIGLVMVFGTLANVVLRYVYGLAPVALYEAVIYAFGMVLTACAGWTWLRDEHVRIDTFYGRMSEPHRAWLNVAGILVLLIPVLWLIWTRGLPYVQRSWATLEGSPDQSGIPYLYVLKSFILVFVVVMAVATVSVLIRQLFIALGHRLPTPTERPGE